MENAKIAKEPEVSSALDDQEKQLERLSELIENICDRFSKALRAEPQTSGEEKDRVESSVPLVNEIRRKTTRIESANEKLRNLLELCEL